MFNGMEITYGMTIPDHRQMFGVYVIEEEGDRPTWFYALVGISLFLLKVVLTLAACVAITVAGAHGNLASLLGLVAGFIIWRPR